MVEKVFRGAQLPVENAAALVPFFEQLYRQQHGELTGPLRALHYGDSHVAADEWTGDIRERLQQTFGDGGSGYSLAGRPWNTYRRFDVKSGSTPGWHSDGLVGRTQDPKDGRVAVLTATRKGRDLVTRVRRERTDALSLVLDGLDDDQRAALTAAQVFP